ncbi:hypothetical protein C8J57DRAFT_1465327 [Mycena rebaudengoi]|nr:hypothetical protein C8J57DRAFT_1465327 [Mycena rebaudengoi]
MPRSYTLGIKWRRRRIPAVRTTAHAAYRPARVDPILDHPRHLASKTAEERRGESQLFSFPHHPLLASGPRSKYIQSLSLRQRRAAFSLPNNTCPPNASQLDKFTAYLELSRKDSKKRQARQRVRSRSLTFPTPPVVNITLANANQLLFHTSPSRYSWVAGKRATLQGDEIKFAAKYMLSATAGHYAIHGGSFPDCVKGVVGVKVVSGRNHQVIIETVLSSDMTPI